MPRQPTVTRTFYVTIAEVMFLNLDTEETFKKEIVMTKIYANNDKILKAIEKRLAEKNITNLKPIHVISLRNESRLYGMTEADFIEKATQMTDRSQKI